MAETATLLEINVTLPVILTLRLVKVLELIFWERVVAELLMYVLLPELATE